MTNTWGDPLTDALQADKAERDKDLDEARQVARGFLRWLRSEYPDSMQAQFDDVVAQYPWLKGEEK